MTERTCLDLLRDRKLVREVLSRDIDKSLYIAEMSRAVEDLEARAIQDERERTMTYEQENKPFTF